MKITVSLLWIILLALGGTAAGQTEPTTFTDLIFQGETSFSSGSFIEAQELYQEALERQPQAPQALAGLGFVLWKLEQPEQAQPLLDQALLRARKDLELTLKVADFFADQEDWKQAAQIYRKALRQQKKEPEILRKLGEVYLNMGENTVAIRYFDQLLKKQPDDYEALLGKSKAWLQLGQFENARRDARQAAKIKPGALAPYLVMGRCPISPAPLKIEGNLKSSKKPNILLFSIDTLRADRLHCYGNPRETSPHLDNLARDAILFRRAISQAPVTAPSHMSILTGMMPDVHLIENLEASTEQYHVLSPRIPTMAEVLKQAGYNTAAFVGGYNVVAKRGFDRGFDIFSEAWKRRWKDSDQIPPQITKWIETTGKNHQPFFLFLHHYYVHGPYVFGPPEFRQKFLNQDTRVEGLPVSNQDLVVPDRMPQQEFWHQVDRENPDHMEHAKALYDGGVYLSDYLFGQIVQLLKENGIYDNTMIIVLGDHGDEFYEHEDVGHYRLFGETLHVPLIIKLPQSLYAAKKVKTPVRLMDIFPSILDYLGLNLPNIQGTSFLKLLSQKKDYSPPITSFGFRHGNLRVEEGGQVYFPRRKKEFLFDLNQDPGEQENLAKQDQAALEQARKRADELEKSKYRYIDLIGCPPDGSKQELSPEEKKDLKSLGYL